jgi:DNA polymerase III delta subunit
MQILHGDDIVSSRNQLQKLLSEAKLAQKEIIQLDGKKCTLTDIKQALESQSLFDQEKLVVIENLFSRQDSKEKKSIINYLFSPITPIPLIIWESRQLAATQLKGSPKTAIQEFKLPTVIFQFLDTFSPGDSNQNLTLLNQVLQTQPPEILFGMFIKRLRYLIVAKHSSQSLSQFPELRDWQQRKILQQANQFTTDQLLNLNQKFMETDYQIKTGRTNLSLIKHLELVVMQP